MERQSDDGSGPVGAQDQTVIVAAAVISRNDSYLVARRPANKRHGRLWEFPGGKADVGESLEQAIRRELKEELDLDVSDVGRVLFEHQDPGSLFRIVFLEVTAAGEPSCREHEELAWVPLDALAEHFDLAPTDRAFVCFLHAI